LRKLRKERRLEIPFILLIEEWNHGLILRALKLDANRVILKRENTILSGQILSKIVKQVLLNYKMRKELEYHREEEFSKMIF